MAGVELLAGRLDPSPVARAADHAKTVQTQPGAGTRFDVTVPQRAPGLAEEPVKAAS